MGDSSIEWTDATWNPVRGCSRVSAGCDNCYAIRQAYRFSGPGMPYEGLTRYAGKRLGGVDWAGHAKLIPEMLSQPLRWRKPRRVFVNSMSDLFHESLAFEEIAAVFGVMAACPQHTFQVLTKRPKRALEFFEWVRTEGDDGPTYAIQSYAAHELGDGSSEDSNRQHDRLWNRANPEETYWPLPNVWLGCSVEDQKTADERIPLLLQCPAAVRFVSAEPLLGPVELDSLPSASGIGRYLDALSNAGVDPEALVPGQLDWVIAGGESGPGARPCHVEWIRSIVRQCKAASVPVFVKQLGGKPKAWAIDMPVPYEDAYPLKHKKGADPNEWPEDIRVREFPEVSP